MAARTDGTPVKQQGRTVQPAKGNHRPRHVFVAPGDSHYAIIPLRGYYRLDGIGDDVSRGKRKTHAWGSHGDTIADPDRVENKSY